MLKHGSLEHRFVEDLPDDVRPGVLYVSMEYGTAAHRCCCGCGEEVVTPFTPTGWKMTYDGETVSLKPSVGNWTLDGRSGPGGASPGPGGQGHALRTGADGQGIADAAFRPFGAGRRLARLPEAPVGRDHGRPVTWLAPGGARIRLAGTGSVEAASRALGTYPGPHATSRGTSGHGVPRPGHQIDHTKGDRRR